MYQKDFTFIVDGRNYRTCRFFADILSPYVRKLHFTDETIDSYAINTNNIHTQSDFNDILSLISFDDKPLNEDQLEYFNHIFLLLGNKELYLKTIPKSTNDLTISNVFEILYQKQKCFLSFKNSMGNDQTNGIYNEILKSEIDFLSAHFYEIDHSKLKQLNISLIEKVVSNSNLQIKDEDSLLQFIIDLYTESKKYYYLFEYVDFLNISQKGIERFQDVFDLNDVTIQIWNKLFERIINSQVFKREKQNDNPKRYKNGKSFPYNSSQEFNGIIKHLTDETGGNIHDNGTIEVSTNRLHSTNHPKNLLDFNDKSFFYGSNTSSNKDAWVCFDFKNKKIKLTNYSIRSHNSNKGNCHPKNWVLEKSNDGTNWSIVDERSNCSTLNGPCITGTFDVRTNDYSRYVRFRQTGELWGGGDIWFNYMEFYGNIQDQ